eukprot:CAMPEP_0183721572 /NCGR_PEP_ID=MMETSP0737-20130205/13808_1 /TAXON_ID=385413 /ORGANISM="Thalassiosira miniscula, Strain CCMP1093" /LENGTH=176 /DNA_ID=CAMNT_0025951609 /DNA_START=48 /DNA_END=578 /DNA_ORIENTATION=+
MPSKDIHQKMQLVPELRSRHARHPLNRSHWIHPTKEARTPQADGDEATFIAYPKPQKGQTVPVKEGYVWGPGSKGFGYYHLLTKDSYVALAARLANETTPTISCCFGGKPKTSKDDTEDIRHVYQFVVYPRSKSPVPNDSVAYSHGIAEGRANFVEAENKQWSEITNPIKQGKVKL